MDWPKVIRELRLMAMQLPGDRFYALLIAACVAAYLMRH